MLPVTRAHAVLLEVTAETRCHQPCERSFTNRNTQLLPCQRANINRSGAINSVVSLDTLKVSAHAHTSLFVPRGRAPKNARRRCQSCRCSVDQLYVVGVFECNNSAGKQSCVSNLAIIILTLTS